jgi:hypothetical protein
MATLLKVLNNLADIKSAGGVALRVRTQDRYGTPLGPLPVAGGRGWGLMKDRHRLRGSMAGIQTAGGCL